MKTVADVLGGMSDLISKLTERTDVKLLIVRPAQSGAGSVLFKPPELFFSLPFDRVRSAWAVNDDTRVGLRRALSELLGKDLPPKLSPEAAAPALWLSLASISIGFVPVVGECYDLACAAARRDLITQQRLSNLEVGMLVAGVAVGAGSVVMVRKLYKSRVIIFSQLKFDPNGANALTRKALAFQAREFRFRFKFKFVDLHEVNPEEAGRMIGKELKRGRTVILNAHGDWDQVFLGGREAAALRNDDLVRLIGRDLGGALYDGSCFSATRRSAWERIVGLRGDVLTLKKPGVDTADGIAELTPLFVQRKLGATYTQFLNGFPFAEYVHGAGR
ncbi:MAG: pre-toxin TG domain-containing protein [Pseudomonadota bacterium]